MDLKIGMNELGAMNSESEVHSKPEIQNPDRVPSQIVPANSAEVAPAGPELQDITVDNDRLADRNQSAKRSSRMPPRKPRPQKPLTPKQYNLLQILYHHGWCTTQILREIAEHYGIPAKGGAICDMLRLLEKRRLIGAVNAQDLRRTLAYAPTEQGVAYIHQAGDGINGDTNAWPNYANMPDTLAINCSLVRLIRDMKCNYWITPIEIGANNFSTGEPIFAAEYDAVMEFSAGTGAVRVGFLHQPYSRPRAEYEQICSRIQNESRLHLIVFVLDFERLLEWMPPSFRANQSKVAFVMTNELIEDGMSCAAFYINEAEIMTAELKELIGYFTKKPLPAYTPTCGLKVRRKR